MVPFVSLNICISYLPSNPSKETHELRHQERRTRRCCWWLPVGLARTLVPQQMKLPKFQTMWETGSWASANRNYFRREGLDPQFGTFHCETLAKNLSDIDLMAPHQECSQIDIRNLCLNPPKTEPPICDHHKMVQMAAEVWAPSSPCPIVFSSESMLQVTLWSAVRF